MKTDTIAQLITALEHLSDNLKHRSDPLGNGTQLTHIADALEELAALETHRLHDAAMRAEQNHKTPSITRAIIEKHPCRRCTHPKAGAA